MKKIDIKIGFSCNNQCRFCVQGDKRKKNPNKTLKKVKQQLQEGKKSADEVVFTGGEPTLRLKELIVMVGCAKKLGYKVIQIQSNGRLFMYIDFCKNLIEAGANEFSPSIHGHNEKIHDFLTSSPGSFRQTMQGIKNLKKMGQRVLTNTVITTYNYNFLPQIARFLVDLDVCQFQFAFPHILGKAWKNRDWLIPRKSQVMGYVKKGLDVGIKVGKRVMVEAIPYCFMQGYERYIAEIIIPMVKIFDANFVIDNYTEYRKKEGKVKGPNCRGCKYFTVCEGPWKEYPKLFGWSEFKPA